MIFFMSSLQPNTTDLKISYNHSHLTNICNFIGIMEVTKKCTFNGGVHKANLVSFEPLGVQENA